MTPREDFLGARRIVGSPSGVPRPGKGWTMDDARQGGGLNPSQRLHLLTSCQYADKLLAEIEAALAPSQPGSPFPRFKHDLSPGQIGTVRDFVAGMRLRMVRVLESQGVPIPEPALGSLHAIRVTLRFIDIAFEECRPRRMTGYGELSPAAATALSGIADEMQAAVASLGGFLAEQTRGSLPPARRDREA